MNAHILAIFFNDHFPSYFRERFMISCCCHEYYFQAVRYLMRFPTEYTCNLLNEARHAAFGKLAAKMVLEGLAGDWTKVNFAPFFTLDIKD